MKEVKPGRYGDGGGLWLQVSQSGTKAWIFRFMKNGRARQMGLGSTETFSLKEARERARDARKLLSDGYDPIESRQATKNAEVSDKRGITFNEAASRYIKAHSPGWRNTKHAAQWQSSLSTYANKTIGDVDVAQIDTSHVVTILEPIWTTKTETASRLRGRIESVLDWATARTFREGENPARWRGHLDKLLAARNKVSRVKHHGALPYASAPEFFRKLRVLEHQSARALEFTILTAARTGEALGARWTEFDLEAGIWVVPGERMKSARNHRVPLSKQTVEMLVAQPRLGDYVFAGARRNQPLSNMAMLQLLRGMHGTEGLTVHGFRSTFRDWAAETTNFPRDVAEAALAHVIGDKTEAAYRRGDALQKRRHMMQDWANFCSESAPAGCDQSV
ncbi:tyrosine-type recombinase/integrase [Endobacterium cereale]